MSRLADDRRTYHPLFRRRNFALRALERKLGRQLDIQEVMDLFGVNENVAGQTRSARWEAEQKRRQLPPARSLEATTVVFSRIEPGGRGGSRG